MSTMELLLELEPARRIRLVLDLVLPYRKAVIVADSSLVRKLEAPA